MQYRELENYFGAVAVSGASAGAKSSAGLDTKGMEQVNVILRTGTIEATGTLDVVIEHSDDDGASDAYATLTGAVFAQKVAANDDITYYGKIKVNTSGVKRYLRITATAATADADYGCVMLASNLSGHLPMTVNALPTAEFSVNDVSV